MSGGSGQVVVYDTTFDEFTRTVSGASWGESTDGHTWENIGTPSAAVSVDGTRGVIACVGNQEAEVVVLGAGPWSIGEDFTMTALLRYDWSATANRLVTFGLGSPAERVFLGVDPRSIGAVRLTVSGSTSNSDSSFSPGSGNQFYVKWEHTPATTALSRAKIWLASDSEPASWLVSRSTAADTYGGQTDELSVFVNSPSGTFTSYFDQITFAADPVVISGR